MDGVSAPLSERTRETYDRHAAAFAAHRHAALFEAPWLDRMLADVPQGGRVLDLGCGSGAPLGDYVAGKGFDVTGADFAPGMLAEARVRAPDRRFIEADMATLELGETFDAIFSWDAFFHLTPAQQRAALPRFAAHLAPGGRLLLTVGPEAGEVTGTVEGDPVYHASLSAPEYGAILAAAGAPVEAFVAEDPSCDFHTILLARRAA